MGIGVRLGCEDRHGHQEGRPGNLVLRRKAEGEDGGKGKGCWGQVGGGGTGQTSGCFHPITSPFAWRILTAGAQDLGSIRSSARETGPERACDLLIDTQLVKGFPEPEPRPPGS